MTDIVGRLSELARITANGKRMLERGNEIAHEWNRAAKGENVAALLIAACILQKHVAEVMARRIGCHPHEVMDSIVLTLTAVADAEGDDQ